MSTPTPAQISAALQQIPAGAPPLALWFNGLFACLAASTCWVIANKEKTYTPWQKLFWIGTIIVLYVFATIHSTIAMSFEMVTFVDNGGSPLILGAFSSQPRWYTGLGTAAEIVNLFIADSLFIWRCWVVWGKRWTVIIIPLLSLIAGNIIAILTSVGQVEQKIGPNRLAKLANQTTVYYALTLATTLYVTLGITSRILVVQFQLEDDGMRKRFARRYRRAIEIIVEGCALYSVLLIATVALAARQEAGASYPVALLPQIAGIVPTMLLFRVANGMTRPNSSWNHSGTLSDAVFRRAATGGVSTRGEPWSTSQVASPRRSYAVETGDIVLEIAQGTQSSASVTVLEEK